ncbi:ABC transporter substrate-binding protein [Shimazuella alba]|uniref:ABC transporter substrate-binding protein n=1 Tax=Shimazuella alba TaxID=2690964 RepID=A0A6I4W0X7_9BACL|nr:ABC transporter substrate-binding protein [Shimazuella alba]MXQ53942.1 ABC transporter substrate-binding protein [Shimazuella alba]
MKKFALWSFMIVFLLSLMGCQAISTTEENSPVDSGDVRYPLTITDQAGNKVTIPKLPERIVSLVPSNTEILFAIGAGKNVVGVTTNDDYPKEVKSLPKVGDMTINAEKVLAQKPDIIFASSLNGKETVDKLKKLGLTVVLLDANSIKEVYQSIDIAGQVTNQLRNSDKLIGKMEAEKLKIFRQVAAVKKEKAVKVWLESDPSLFTAGKGTLLNELTSIAGGDNVAKNLNGWPQVQSETVVKWNPDVIVSMYGDTKTIQNRAGWNAIRAVQEKRITSIDPNIVSRPGPRIMEAMHQLAKTFYPGQVK